MYVRSQTLSCKEHNKDNMRTQFWNNSHAALHFAQKLMLSHGMQV